MHKHGLDFRNIPPVRGTNGIDWWIRSLAIKKSCSVGSRWSSFEGMTCKRRLVDFLELSVGRNASMPSSRV